MSDGFDSILEGEPASVKTRCGASIRRVAADPEQWFETRAAARFLGITPLRLGTLVRGGLVRPAKGPNGHNRFTFQDLVVLRRVLELLEQGISLRQIRGALTKLEEHLPDHEAVSAVRLQAEGGELLAVRDGETWHLATGQKRLDFGAGQAGIRVVRLLRGKQTSTTEDGSLGDREGIDRKSKS